MADEPPAPGADAGLLGSARSLIATAIGAAETRIALLGTELEEERRRLLLLALGAAAFLFSLFLGTTLLAILVVVLYWDTQRVLVLGLLTGTFLGLALAIGVGLRVWLRTVPRPFHATRAELAKDRERLGPH
jgi:uncharacterized membrane protein YqjE